jgi:hypothetical protein
MERPFTDLSLYGPKVRFSQTEKHRKEICNKMQFLYPFFQAILDHHFEGNLNMSPSPNTVISDTVPVPNPVSLANRSPSRQSSHESTEAVNPVSDDDEPDTEGRVHQQYFLLVMYYKTVNKVICIPKV